MTEADRKTLTGEERVAYLVKLALEAYDAERDARGARDAYGRVCFERLVTERMRQAAQVWTSEINEATP